MIDDMKRHEVQVLLAAGHSERRVAKLAGVPRTSVQRIAKEEPVADAGEKRLRVVRGAGRPSEMARFRTRVIEILKEKPDLLSVEILRRLREVGYEGGKSAAYDFIAMLRSPKAPPLVRFEGLAGEFSQHDFGSVAVAYDDGTKEQVHFFASRLKYSRFAHVRVVPSERVEPLVRALLESFEVLGGVQLVAVFDNPKTVVIRRHGTKIDWNETFGQAALDLRFAAQRVPPARVRDQAGPPRLPPAALGRPRTRLLPVWMTDVPTAHARSGGVPACGPALRVPA